MSNNSVRHFSTIGTRHVDFYLSREGRKRLGNWFLASFLFPLLLMWLFWMQLILLLITVASKGQGHCSRHHTKRCGCQRKQPGMRFVCLDRKWVLE